MPANTFVATANMAIAAGYVPNPIDTDEDGILRNKLTHVSVTYSGNPTPMGIIGDDAHYVMRGMGSRSQLVSVLSTHAIKPITTGEGGVILTNHQNLYLSMKEVVDHGRNEGGFGFGYNFRMPSLNAALGISQLEQADINLSRRQKIAKYYDTELMGLYDVIVPLREGDHCYHLYPILLKEGSPKKTQGANVNSMNLAKFLESEGIGTQKHYPSLDSYDHIDTDKMCKNARKYYRETLSIPMSAAMTMSDAETVVKTIKKYFGA